VVCASQRACECSSVAPGVQAIALGCDMCAGSTNPTTVYSQLALRSALLGEGSWEEKLSLI
jgi:hypothetical protein